MAIECFLFSISPLIFTPVPPDIINEDSSVDMAVQEGEDAALTCRAVGNNNQSKTLLHIDPVVMSI